MSTTTHNLKHNGAAYNDDATLINPDTKVTSGAGRALCTCGIMSEVLQSGSARRVWHKGHKLAALEAEATPEQAPETEVVLGQDVLAGTPEDEVADALAELVGEAPAPAAPKKVSTRRKAEIAAGFELPEGAVTVEVPFSNTVALHFWHQLGRPSAKVLAEKYPALQVTHEDKTRTVKVTGDEATAQQAATELAAAWAAAPEAFKAWKATTPAYRALKHTQPADRRISHAMTVAYWGGYAREQLLGPDA